MYGLCNQLFAIIHQLMINDKKIMVIDGFRSHFSSRSCGRFSEIIDLETTGKRNNVILLDPNKIEVIHASYGSDTKRIDVTDKVKKYKFLYRNINTYLSDPTPGVRKTLTVKYRRGGETFSLTTRERNDCFPDPVVFDLGAIRPKVVTLTWYNSIDEQKFVKILRSIKFKPEFYSNKRYKNVVHLRIAKDGVKHWARMNKMKMEIFEKKLHDLYWKLITTHIKFGESVLLLTSVTDGKFIEKLKSKYVIEFSSKEYSGRELNALKDMLAGSTCSDVFIGCHNTKLHRGSTFSYCLTKLMNNHKTVLLDLDDIDNKVEIHHR